MTRRALFPLPLLLTTLLAAAPRPAQAIPSFARKYETSCLTCHTVYPKLTPFGEAFRRNGYRFPGVDSDYQKQPQIPLGQEANKKTFPNSVWPSGLPGSSVVAVGANGKVVGYPDPDATVPRENPGLRFTMDDIVSEAHLWAGAALDDTTTVWAELTLASDGTVSIEHAQVLLNDLLGPKHAVNLVVGRGFPTLTSFGSHSSYLGDALVTNAPVTSIYGLSADPFVLVDNVNGFELNGVLGGQLGWSAGVAAGKNSFTTKFSSENVYGHVGYKIGGLRMDGEGSQGPANAMRPWAEDSLTLDLFAYRSVEHGAFDLGAPPPTTEVRDLSVTYGAAVRGQLGSAELNVGAYLQDHDHASISAVPDFPSVKADVEWAELSYVVFPWMVPAVRVERIGLKPTGAPSANAVHVMPGIAFLIRANVKAVLVANYEISNGFPQDAGGAGLAWDGGNADWGNFVAAPKDPANPTASQKEFESISLYLGWAM